MGKDRLPSSSELHSPKLKLDSGSRVGVIGGGPAGSFFSYFLLEMAQRVGIDVQLDVYEPRDYSRPGPGGCNMCGGVISESLVQALASEGIILPPTVVQRGIDSYTLHMDVGSVWIQTPLQEKRIAVVHRGAGPRGIREVKWRSFDGHLQELAADRGARVVRRRVDGVEWEDGRPQIKTQNNLPEPYDLLVAAVGVNSSTLKLLEGLGLGYRPPRTTKTYISELYIGAEMVETYLGSSMHVFLLNLPGLEFAALIPKGDYVTLCLLGREINAALLESFLNAPEVRECLPPNWRMTGDFCHCSPRMNMQAAVQPYADRIVFIGDCGVSRLYKDGIGAAYRTAKAAAVTAIFEGISAEDFRRHYGPVCKALSTDNLIGQVVFGVTRLIQKIQCTRRGVFRMVAKEQQRERGPRHMSMVLWDVFTGSAPYREVFLRTLRPSFLGGFLWDTGLGIWPQKSKIQL